MSSGNFPHLPKGDRKAAALLLVAAVAAGMIFYATGDWSHVTIGSADSAAVRTVRHDRPNYYYQGERQVETFDFDPNTADSTTLLRLGLSPWQVRSIYRYRAKGGAYHEKTDFARLYGLTVADYRRLEPHICISPDYRPAAEVYAAARHPARGGDPLADSLRHAAKTHEAASIAVNEADSATLCRVPGIGPYYARQIIRYRERLGGYHALRQLEEIDGFPADALPYLALGSATLRKININTATMSQLRRHPYIIYLQARDICDYRRLHGTIRDLADLSLLSTFPPAQIERLRPYVEY